MGDETMHGLDRAIRAKLNEYDDANSRTGTDWGRGEMEAALLAVLELHAPIDGGPHVCADRIEGEEHFRATEHITVHEVTCPTVLAIAKQFGIVRQ